jgi:hypothetical protein
MTHVYNSCATIDNPIEPIPDFSHSVKEIKLSTGSLQYQNMAQVYKLTKVTTISMIDENRKKLQQPIVSITQ